MCSIVHGSVHINGLGYIDQRPRHLVFGLCAKMELILTTRTTIISMLSMVLLIILLQIRMEEKAIDAPALSCPPIPACEKKDVLGATPAIVKSVAHATSCPQCPSCSATTAPPTPAPPDCPLCALNDTSNKVRDRYGVYQNMETISIAEPLPINDETVGHLEKEILESITYVPLPVGKQTYADGVGVCRTLTTIQGYTSDPLWSGVEEEEEEEEAEKEEEEEVSGAKDWKSVGPTILGPAGTKHPMPNHRRYQGVHICSNEETHVAFMAGYDAMVTKDALGNKIAGPGWVEDVFPAGSGAASGMQAKLKDGEHATVFPARLPKGQKVSDHPNLTCKRSGVNFKPHKGEQAAGVFCCRDFPMAVNKNTCDKPGMMYNGMYKRSNAQFFGFLKFAQVTNRYKIPFHIVQGVVFGLARSGDMLCNDHDIDMFYNIEKLYPKDKFWGDDDKDNADMLDEGAFIEKVIPDIHAAGLNVVGDRAGEVVWNIDGPKPTLIKSGMRRRGISWNYVIDDIGCVDGAGEGNDVNGISRVRLGFNHCDGKTAGPRGCSFPSFFSEGLQTGNLTYMNWRGYRAPVPAHPYLYLESVDASWWIPKGDVTAGTESRFSMPYLNCIVANGGSSRFELITNKDEALMAKLKEKCGAHCKQNCAWDQY